MAKTAPDRVASGERLIGGAFGVESGRVLPQLAGGAAAFGVHDRKGRRDDLMAVPADPARPPRAQALAALAGATIPGLCTPVAHGEAAAADGGAGYFVICRAPAGVRLGGGGTIARPWTDAELLACVLRPVAACLAALAQLRVTHRAIRPDNVFQAAPGHPAVLGQAWAAPPASLQPAVFEPPYMACCHPGGRGEGGIADDVYALGVLLLALAAGAWPMGGRADADIAAARLAHGSHAAILADLRVSPMIADVTRGMLAEDPEHRPSPAQVADPDALRSRRVAARPVRQAQRPLELNGTPVWTARALAGGMAAQHAAAVALLRSGAVDRWLRRGLGDAALAARIEDAVRTRAASTGADQAAADALLAARAIAILDPLAPLCWRGLVLWPDGLGGALAAAGPAENEALQQMIATEAIAAWAAMRPGRADPALLRMEARQHRSVLQRGGWGGGLSVLRYALDPLAACASPLLGGRFVNRLEALLPALEAAASGPGGAAGLPLDSGIAAFIVAREDLRTGRHLAALGAREAQPGAAALAQLQVLARLQQRFASPPLPRLAARLAAALRPALAGWRSRSRRAQLAALLDDCAARGDLPALAALIDNPQARSQDQREAEHAQAALAQLDAALARHEAGRASRAAAAAHAGQEAAVALGVIALSSAALWLVL